MVITDVEKRKSSKRFCCFSYGFSSRMVAERQSFISAWLTSNRDTQLPHNLEMLWWELFQPFPWSCLHLAACFHLYVFLFHVMPSLLLSNDSNQNTETFCEFIWKCKHYLVKNQTSDKSNCLCVCNSNVHVLLVNCRNSVAELAP